MTQKLESTKFPKSSYAYSTALESSALIIISFSIVLDGYSQVIPVPSKRAAVVIVSVEKADLPIEVLVRVLSVSNNVPQLPALKKRLVVTLASSVTAVPSSALTSIKS